MIGMNEPPCALRAMLIFAFSGLTAAAPEAGAAALAPELGFAAAEAAALPGALALAAAAALALGETAAVLAGAAAPPQATRNRTTPVVMLSVERSIPTSTEGPFARRSG